MVMLSSLGGQIGEFVARKRAEDDRNRFFDLSQDIFCVVDFEGRFGRISPSFETVLGYRNEELLAKGSGPSR